MEVINSLYPRVYSLFRLVDSDEDSTQSDTREGLGSSGDDADDGTEDSSREYRIASATSSADKRQQPREHSSTLIKLTDCTLSPTSEVFESDKMYLVDDRSALYLFVGRNVPKVIVEVFLQDTAASSAAAAVVVVVQGDKNQTQLQMQEGNLSLTTLSDALDDASWWSYGNQRRSIMSSSSSNNIPIDDKKSQGVVVNAISTADVGEQQQQQRSNQEEVVVVKYDDDHVLKYTIDSYKDALRDGLSTSTIYQINDDDYVEEEVTNVVVSNWKGYHVDDDERDDDVDDERQVGDISPDTVLQNIINMYQRGGINTDATANEKIDVYKVALTSKDAEIGRYIDQLDKKNSELDLYRNILSGKETELEKYKRVLSDKSSEISRLNELLSNRDTEIDRFQTTLSSKEIEIDMFHVKLTDYEDVIRRLKQTLGHKDDEVHQLKESLRSRDVEIETCMKALASKDIEIATTCRRDAIELGRLKDALGSCETELEQCRATLRDVTANAEETLEKQRAEDMMKYQDMLVNRDIEIASLKGEAYSYQKTMGYDDGHNDNDEDRDEGGDGKMKYGSNVLSGFAYLLVHVILCFFFL